MTSSTHVPRRWLTVAHVAWYICAIWAAIVLVAAVPVYYHRLAQPLTGDPYGLGPFNAPFQTLVGFSDIASGFISFALAVLLFWRKSNDRMALFTSYFFLITAVVWNYSLDYFLTAYFGAPSTFELWSNLSVIPGILLFCIFPDGRFVPRWTRGLFWLSIPLSLFSILAVGEWSFVAGLLAFPMFFLTAYAQVYRYRHVSGYVERQQTKWVVLGAVVSILLAVIASLIYKTFTSPLINITPLTPVNQSLNEIA